MKVYYAHHIWKYNTKIEQYELGLIQKYFPYAEIINPNNLVNQSQIEESIMADCFDYVRDCDVIVFSSLSGVVGKGVVDEVELGYSLHKAVFYIINNIIKAIPSVEFEKIEDSKNNRVYAVVKIA